MKKLTLLKALFLLCALVVGSSSVWADEEVTLWSEDFSSYSANDVPAGGTYKYSCGGDNTKIYEENLAQGTSPELLLQKNNNGTFTAVIPLDKIEGDLTLTFTTNKQSIKVETTTPGLSGSLEEKASGTHTVKFEGVTTSTTSITIKFTCTGSSNVRLDDILLKGTRKSSDPSASLSTTSLDFGKVTIGETKELTFTVTPSNLTGDLTIASNNAKYIVSPTSIAQATTTATTITVTASPTAESDNMDGIITISGGGLAANKTVTLTTTAFDPANANIFVKVTDASTLRAGDQLIILADTKGKVMGAINSGYFNAVDVTIESDGTIIDPANANVLSLDGEEDAWYFKQNSDNKYILSSSKSASTGTKADNGKTTISISSGNATISFSDGNFQYNASSPRFKVYSPGQTAVQLYRLSKSVTITSAEYATYSGSKALNFDGVGITVYTAQDKETSVGLTEITSGQVPANTPVVLYKEGADGTAINVPVIASADDPEGTNDLRVSTGTDVDNMYVLAMNPTIGFYPWTGTNLPAGKIYLQGKASYGARSFIGFDSNTTTSIDNVVVKTIDENAPMYNLAGQRVNKSYKGVVIVNGKKMLNK